MTTDTNQPAFENSYFGGPIWHWFGLSYCGYLVAPRTLLCGMPLTWQEKFVALLDEYNEAYDFADVPQAYTVQTRDKKGHFIKDSYADYRYPKPLPYKDKAPCP